MVPPRASIGTIKTIIRYEADGPDNHNSVEPAFSRELGATRGSAATAGL